MLQSELKRLKCVGKKAELDIQVALTNSKNINLELKKGSKRPDEGWISPTYLARTPAPLLNMHSKVTLPFELLTMYVPNKIRCQDKTKINIQNDKITIANSIDEYEIYPENNKCSFRKTGVSRDSAKVVLCKRRPNKWSFALG